ncbi:MAG: hypothetical protein HYX48_04330 [Chlamydiales bacterium]|nr:hypothetical protein [Chlamydiales bacterium]
MSKTFAYTCALSLLGSASLSAHDDLGIGYHWSLLTEFVYMQRSELHSHSIVDKYTPNQSCPCDERSVMNTKDLLHDFDFEPGFRVGLSYQPDDRWTLEGNYLYLNEWEGDDTHHGNGTLSFPSYLGVDGFNAADRAEGNYRSRFWNAELNIWTHVTPRKVDAYSYSWVVGLRYINLREIFDIAFFTDFFLGEDKSIYSSHVHNHLGGPQIGGCLEWNATHQLTWMFSAKFGPMADRVWQKTYVAADNNTNVLRNFTKHSWTAAFLADVAASAHFQVTSHFNVHAGYEMIYLTGVALAPEQSQRQHHHVRKEVNSHGNALHHGLFAGLIISF